MGVVDPDAPTISVHAAGGGEAPRVPDATAALVSGEEVGRYTVRRVIDAGGMGVVYEADDRSLGRRVALKVLRSGQTRDPAMAARLVREARTAAGLSHPNVVAVYEVGVHATGPFIAMELVAGTTLRQWLAATPRRWREIVRVFREAGLGIAAAHAAGIVHRDIKPDNILVGDDRVRVADFGLARFAQAPAEPVPATPSGEAAGDRITQVGAVLGTPRYMAPEQREGRDADARADQFSFCTSLDEALTGARDVPVRIRRAIARGMDPDPEARHPSMDALLRELVDEDAAGSALGLGVLRDETAPPHG
ncbi:MAG: serine/threonine protein kinase, partial [Deltaproteobacteria bacterium]|nr:serine/threonine protein kinase [Kofleriaceae bacterium]